MGLRQDGLEHKLPARADGLGWFYRWRLAGWLTWQAKIQAFYEKKQNQELRSCAKKHPWILTVQRDLRTLWSRTRDHRPLAGSV